VINVSTAVARYLESEDFIRLAPGTKVIRRRVLGNLAGLSRVDVDNCMAVGRATSSEATLNSWRGALRMFGRWLQESGYTKSNPAAHLHNVKEHVAASKRKPLNIDKTIALLDLADGRMRITLALALFTGLRESELLALKWADADWSAGEFRSWRQKTQDTHVSPWPPRLRVELERWRQECPADSVHVIPGRWRDKPCTSLYRPLKALLVSAGLVEQRDGRGVHVFRRSFAQALYTVTKDIRAVQVALGHSTVSTTERYLSIDEQVDTNRRTIGGWNLGSAA
jgi:integrase/recombinase XerC